jgi:hypothetical protein
MNNEQWRINSRKGNLFDYNRRDGAWPSGYSEGGRNLKNVPALFDKETPADSVRGRCVFCGSAGTTVEYIPYCIHRTDRAAAPGSFSADRHDEQAVAAA